MDFYTLFAGEIGFFVKMSAVAVAAVVAGILIRRSGSAPRRSAAEGLLGPSTGANRPKGRFVPCVPWNCSDSYPNALDRNSESPAANGGAFI